MVVFRDAAAADAHGIATVLTRSWRAAYRGLLPDDVLGGLSVADRERFWSGVLAEPPPRVRLVVAIGTGGVVGFAASGPPLVPPDPADPDDPAVGDIYALYLDPDVWGRGLGSQLHAAALERLRAGGFRRAGLWVLDGNERALRFYARHHWTDTGRTRVDEGPGGCRLHERRLVRATTD